MQVERRDNWDIGAQPLPDKKPAMKNALHEENLTPIHSQLVELQWRDEHWQLAWDLNVMAAVRFSRALIPGMVERQWGRIINIGSTSGREPDVVVVHYNCAKAGLLALSKTLANAYSSLQQTDWLSKKLVRIIIQHGFRKHRALPDVPLSRDLARNETERQMADLLNLRDEITRHQPQNLARPRNASSRWTWCPIAMHAPLTGHGPDAAATAPQNAISGDVISFRDPYDRTPPY